LTTAVRGHRDRLARRQRAEFLGIDRGGIHAIGPTIVRAQHERRALVGNHRAVQLLGAGAEDVAEGVEHPAEPALAVRLVLLVLLVLRRQWRRSGEDERERCKNGQSAHGSSSHRGGRRQARCRRIQAASARRTMPINITTAPAADSRTRCASPNTKTPMAIANRISTCLTASTYDDSVIVYAFAWRIVVSAAKRPSETNS